MYIYIHILHGSMFGLDHQNMTLEELNMFTTMVYENVGNESLSRAHRNADHFVCPIYFNVPFYLK